MSNLLQLLFNFSLVFLILSSVSAFQFGFSPPILEFDRYSDRCHEVELFLEKPVSVYIEDRWSERDSKNVLDYNMSKNILNYPKNINLRDNPYFRVCLIEMPPYDAYGILIININNSSFSGGLWIKILIGKKEIYYAYTNNTRISGFGVLENEEKASDSIIEYDSVNTSLIYLLLFETIFILIAFLCLFFIFRGAKKRRSY